MAARVREAWVAEDRPPLAVMSGAIASAGAVHGYRGEEAAAVDWFDFADSISAGGAQAGGVMLMRADVALHHGRPDRAAERLEQEGGDFFWWNAQYLAVRAEARVLVGADDADEALERAFAVSDEHPFARATALRSRALRLASDEPLRESIEIFRAIECPYQEARSGWLLGGAERDAATAIFERLRVAPPA